MKWPMSLLVWGLVCVTFGMGCAGAQELPEPPEPGEKRTVAGDPGAEDRRRQRNVLEARAAVIELYGHLENERFEEAAELLAPETQRHLTDGRPQRAVEILKSSSLDPTELLLGGRPSRLEAVETEVDERVVLENRADPGRPFRITVVERGGEWTILHASTP